MKIKLDENLPVRLATLLKNFGHEVHTLHEQSLMGHPDREVWEAAQKESRFLVTQDLDFSDSRQFAPGSHHGILLIRLRSPNRRNLIKRIEEMFQKENVGDWAGCFVVATERKIRVLRPGRKQNS
jgi:predicted nuclease of predicted toxin-antitoxin system